MTEDAAIFDNGGMMALTDAQIQLSRKAADLIVNQLRTKPDSCLALPTGRTPRGCYQLLSEWSLRHQLDWSKAKCFALDDYLDCEEPNSFQTFLESHLYRHTNLPTTNRFNPRFWQDYDSVIEKMGGLDLTMIGIGENGHIAFNEPGTPRQSFTHCVWLTESTRQANTAFFGSLNQVPVKAVTMGLETILASRKIVLIASGAHKREILERALNGPVTTNLPASFLQQHPALTVITDFQ